MNIQALPMKRFVNRHGDLELPLPGWAEPTFLRTLYTDMMTARTYDYKAVALQRTGQLGTYPSHLGAEAIGVAIGRALTRQDVFIPYYRDMPAMWVRGIAMEKNCNIGEAMNEAAISISMMNPTLGVETCHSAFRSPLSALTP